MKSNFINRIKLFKAFFVLAVFILIVKLYFVQIVHGDRFSERANRQYVTEGLNVFDRGNIFFTAKDGSLVAGATLRQGFTVAINPEVISSADDVYVALSNYIDLDKKEFYRKAGRKDDPYEEVARRINKESAEKIGEMKLKGVSLHKTKWRYYPGNTSASQVLGFVGYKGDELRGIYGLESYYDGTLAKDSDKLYVNFFAEIFSSVGKIIGAGKERKGDIITSIEPTVQSNLETVLGSVEDKWKSKITGGIVMDPKTGEIIAMATLPGFNPNDFSSADPAYFQNPLVGSVYELGSIIKPITVALGIDSGTITAESTYFDKGYIEANGARISNHDGVGRGLVGYQEVLSQSLNTGVANIVLQMGRDKFSEYMKKFELGEETGIDLPGEVRSLTDNLNSPRDIEHITASYGQGIALTPISAVRALAAVANGGILPEPHLTRSIDYEMGFSKNLAYGEGKRILKKESSEDVTRFLVNAFDDTLLNGRLKMEHYSVAAKTGTAQIAKENGRGYYENGTLHSFFGYFPAFDPKFIVFMFTVEPKGAEFASETLAVPFSEATKFLINYYEIPPDR